MHKKFEINRKKIKGGCQSGRKVVTHNSKSYLPLVKLYSSIKGGCQSGRKVVTHNSKSDLPLGLTYGVSFKVMSN